MNFLKVIIIRKNLKVQIDFFFSSITSDNIKFSFFDGNIGTLHEIVFFRVGNGGEPWYYIIFNSGISGFTTLFELCNVGKSGSGIYNYKLFLK